MQTPAAYLLSLGLAWMGMVGLAAEESTTDATAEVPERPVGVRFEEAELLDFLEYVQLAYEDSEVPGLALTTVQGDGKMSVSAVGVRDVDSQKPVTQDTRFALGETTGALMSLLVSVAEERGKATIDEPLRTVGGGIFQLPDDERARVTLRALWSQTGGVPTQLDSVLAEPRNETADLLAALYQTALTDPPESRFQPSKAGQAAAAYALSVELQAGQPGTRDLRETFLEVSHREVLRPLGIQGGAFSRLDLLQTRDFALGHLPAESDSGWAVEETYNADTAALLPAQGLRACIIDVAVWLSFEVRLGMSVYEIDVLPQQRVRERWQPVLRDLEGQPALGWGRDFVGGVPVVVCVGSIDQQSALVAVLPEHQTALGVLTNVGGDVSAELFRDLLITFCEMSERARERENAQP